MARKLGLYNEVTEARTLTAAPIAAESATLSDANYPLVSALGCRGYDTIWVGVEITLGTNPTATIEALFRDGEAAGADLKWHRRLLGAPPGITALASLAAEDTGALLSNGAMAELRVDGAAIVYLRIKAVTNATNTTACKILVMPGKRRPSI